MNLRWDKKGFRVRLTSDEYVELGVKGELLLRTPGVPISFRLRWVAVAEPQHFIVNPSEWLCELSRAEFEGISKPNAYVTRVGQPRVTIEVDRFSKEHRENRERVSHL